MDDKTDIKVKRYLEDLSTLYINSILKLAAPEIVEDFPAYPFDLPEELNYKPPPLEEKQSTPSIKNKDEEKPPKIRKVSLETPKRCSKRSSRFKGRYNVDDVQEIDRELETGEMFVFKEENVEPKNYPSQEEFFTALSMKKTVSKLSQEVSGNNDKKNTKSETVNFVPNKKKRKLKQLSDTSSDEEEVTSNEKIDMNPTCHIERCDELIKMYSRNSMNNESKKVSPKKVQKKTPTPSTSSSSIQKEQKKPQKIQNKPVNKKMGSFEEALMMISEKKKGLKNFVIPKLIPAPETDPMIKKVVKKKPAKKSETAQNPNSHLGGIFTINNGWDKSPDEKKQHESPNYNRVKRQITQPNIVVDSNLETEILAAHEEFMYNGDFLENLPSISPTTSYSDSSYANAKNDECSMDKNTTENIKIKKVQSSVNSSEDYDSYEDEEVIKPVTKKAKPVFSDDEEQENELSENFKRNTCFDADAISLCAGDLGDLDDFEDEIPVEEKKENQYDVQLEDLELELVPQTVQCNIAPMDPQSEFDMNTKQIAQHMVDPETDRILKTYFGDVCPAYLEKRCVMPGCTRNHFLTPQVNLYPLIINAPFDTLQSVFQVVLRFHRLFEVYISIFAEICIKNKDDKGLIELVKACDRLPRTIICYKDIFKTLISTSFMKEHQAIRFIIAHHKDSEIARDTILGLILDSGPCLPFFMDYIERVHMINPIRVDQFSRILHTCVSYQNPKLPNFCLNYLQGTSMPQMHALNTSHLTTFVQMNSYLSEVNASRQAKTMALIQKMFQISDH